MTVLLSDAEWPVGSVVDETLGVGTVGYLADQWAPPGRNAGSSFKPTSDSVFLTQL